MKTNIENLEKCLQKIFETLVAGSLLGNQPEDDLAQKLVAAMDDNAKKLPDGQRLSPNLFVIIAHPATLANWHVKTEALNILSDALQETGENSGYSFQPKPKITTAADVNMKPGELCVLASFQEESENETMNMIANNNPNETEIPVNAYLILQGTSVIPLIEPVITIGRRLDNQIVIDDPRVSRNHAQMRVIKKRFVIFDLESTGGLFVNGQRTAQSILYPGDVISLAGVTLIYGQDVPASKIMTQEQTGSAASSDRPTAVLRKNEISSK